MSTSPRLPEPGRSCWLSFCASAGASDLGHAPKIKDLAHSQKDQQRPRSGFRGCAANARFRALGWEQEDHSQRRRAHVPRRENRRGSTAAFGHERGPARLGVGQHHRRLAEAEAFFSAQIKANPRSAFAFLMRGVVRYENDDLDHAVADLDQALKIDPKYVPALIERAYLWQWRNQLDEAIADVSMAIELDPRNSYAFVERGVFEYSKKEYDKALARFSDGHRPGLAGRRDLYRPRDDLAEQARSRTRRSPSSSGPRRSTRGTRTSTPRWRRCS